MGINVLLIEDDDDFRDSLARYLGQAGMDVVALPEAAGLEHDMLSRQVHVLVCDINLPGESGFSVAGRVRRASKCGVIVLTGRTESDDRMLGLTLGADHYLVKPVKPRELEMTIRNLHQRLFASANDSGAYSEGGWVFHALQWTLTAPNGRVAQLTLTERHICVHLMRRSGKAVTRDELMSALSRADIDAYRRNLDVSVSRLRRKIEEVCGEKLPIMAARGIGYVFNGPAQIQGDG